MMMSRAAATISALLSPPLRGRGGEGGITTSSACGSPPSLTLPRKGGGNTGSVPEKLRALILGVSFALPALLASGLAYAADDVIAAPVLRGNVTVTGDLVRV